MAAGEDSVNPEPHRSDTSSEDESPGLSPWERVPPGITIAELIAAVGNLKLPDDGFADALEAVQAEQPLADMPHWRE